MEETDLKLKLETASARLTKIDQQLEAANDKYNRYDELLQEEGLSEVNEAKYEKERAAATENRDSLIRQRDPLLVRITEREKLLKPSSNPTGKILHFSL